MKDFSQEFYNWLLEENESLEDKAKNDDIGIRVGFGNQLIFLNKTIKNIKKYVLGRKLRNE